MALPLKDLTVLAKIAANATPSSPAAYSFNNEQYSYQEVNETLRRELNELAGTWAAYRENKNTIFTLMEETIDDVLPKKVMEQYGMFAEIKTFNQGDKPVFTQKITNASRQRAKQFVTKVGLAGIYEVFKLDQKSFEVPTSAFGGAAQIGFEEFLDGRVDMSDVLDIVMEGLDRCVYTEIEGALIAAIDELPRANMSVQQAFDESEMDRLLSIADSYGTATIYCTFEFAATMVPSEGWVSDDMRNQRWNNGYIANYKGHRVVVLDQSYEDETNETKVIDPSFAWILPSGMDRPIKIAFEGQTIVNDYDNYDRSKEIQVYKKMGAAAIVTNDMCVYRNTSLVRDEYAQKYPD
ncbi:MAG: hypothetical protein LUC37_02850 [Prevotella sp.]|nr:hypothetical protein [Prevotella sp.]